MKAIELDFRPVRRSSMLGLGLLCAGLLLVAVVLSSLHEVRTRVAQELGRLSEYQLLQPAPVERSAREQAARRKVEAAQRERVDGARAVAERLSVPWGRLLAAVEAADSLDIAVTALAPDPKKRLIRIDGQARNVHAMLDYNARLARSAMLGNVSLVSHELLQQEPDRPVRFSLTASWSLQDDAAQ